MDDNLFSLIHTSSFRQLQLILECGNDVNCRNSRQETPFMAAMISIPDLERRQAVLQLLLRFGADVNCRNSRGQTALMYSCIRNQLDTLDILMKCVDNQERKRYDQRTLEHLSEEFLDYNMKDFEGNTALMYACALGSKDSVKLLMDAHNIRHMRLDFDAANNDGATAMLLAHDNFFHDIVQMLSSSMTEQKAGCLICVQESNHEQKRKKEIRRIQKLAEIIKDAPKLNDTEDSAPIECAEDDENLRLAHAEMTLTKRYPEACPEETSQPGTSIAKSEEDLRKSSDHLKELLNQAIESREEIKHILDNCGIGSSDETRIANEPASNKKKTKRKTKRKRRKYRNEDIPNYGKAVTNENEPRSEYAVGSRIYSVDIYEQEDVTSIRQNIKSNARRKLYDAVNIDSEGNAQYFEIETGKMDCLKLNSEARAKLLGRTVWSVYGAPLPPIPIDDEELQNVIDKISALRKYLRRPKMHEGRLVSLDPELWCIIESMRNELEPT